MERLALCSRTLYDKDLCDKATEISQLKRTLAKYVTPVVSYSTRHEWEANKAKMHEIIETGIRKYVIGREGDEEYSNFGITAHQKIQICGVIKEALMGLTGCEEWSIHMASTVTDSVDGFFGNLRREQILDIVMSTVYQYLSVETLNSIPQFCHTEHKLEADTPTGEARRSHAD
jgi:hypothetical protein